MLYQRLIFPLLSRWDAETVHTQTLNALAFAQRSGLGRWFLRQLRGRVPSCPVNLFGLTFPNPLGVAAGFDKDGRVPAALALLGFGHIEIGTLTPRPQEGNPRPRIFRLPEDKAIINRMGFPNGGVVATANRLQNPQPSAAPYILGVSLGKQKETALEDALKDYLVGLRAVHSFADYLAINVSSPNTPGLRALQGGDYLEGLIAGILAETRHLAGNHAPLPVLIKIAPDLSWAELDEILAIGQRLGVSGIIAANTTLNRQGLQNPAQMETGGLSGSPLRQRCRQIVHYIHQQTSGQLPIIGVGGVSSPDDLLALLDMGASLVQVYTGLVYAGPRLAGQMLRDLEERKTF